MNVYKKIYKEIKKHKKIVIARHIGPDPDALGSSIGLKESIINTFPNKEVYVVGTPAAKHKYITFNRFCQEKSCQHQKQELPFRKQIKCKFSVRYLQRTNNMVSL